MPDKQAELQVPLEKILDSKKGKHGHVFLIKISHYKPMWVPEKKLSIGAATSHLNGSALPPKAYVVLARRYAKPPVKRTMKSMFSYFGNNSGKRGSPTTLHDETESPEKKKSRTGGDETKNTSPIESKIINRLEAWCGQARIYIRKFNAIVDLKNKSELVKMINEAKEELQPNKECIHLFQSAKFQCGSIIKHNKEHINCLSSCQTTGKISCAVCEETYKFSRACRVINHCFHKTHIHNLKKKQVDTSHQRATLQKYAKDGYNETCIVRLVQNCVAQQIALKGLPFTAGMCVSHIQKKRIN